jgi:hypothetical protein
VWFRTLRHLPLMNRKVKRKTKYLQSLRRSKFRHRQFKLYVHNFKFDCTCSYIFSIGQVIIPVVLLSSTQKWLSDSLVIENSMLILWSRISQFFISIKFINWYPTSCTV